MKRKTKDGEETKESKPKKYKRKIENPEKQKARYVYDNKGESGKLWEKNRRDRLNKTFEELALLLPPKDPPGKMSKIEILVAAIKSFETMSEKLVAFESELNVLKEKNTNVTKTFKKDTKDGWCNTHSLEQNKENNSSKVDKNTQVNFMKKRKKVLKKSTTKITEIISARSTSNTPTTNMEIISTMDKNSTNPSTSNLINTTILSEPSFTIPSFPTESNTVSSTTLTNGTIARSVPYLSNSVRVTPALISTPIMTPSLFISNYPFVVSQMPQSVYIVNNKTEVTTTVNKMCAVKSKTSTGRIPLPPLRKTVSIKKHPRNKRVLKKTLKNNFKKIRNGDENLIRNKTDDKLPNKSTKLSNDILECSSSTSEKTRKLDKNKPLVETDSIEINSVCKEINFSKGDIVSSVNDNSEKSLAQPVSIVTIVSTSSENNHIEKSPLTPTLLNLETSQRTPQSQEVAGLNDTSTISNLDLENLLLTDNILSSMETSETNECIAQNQELKPEGKEKLEQQSSIKMLSESKTFETTKPKGSGKNIEVLEIMEKEKSKVQARSIQIRRELQHELNINSVQLHKNNIETVITTAATYLPNYNSCVVSNSFTFSLSSTTSSTSQDTSPYQIKSIAPISSRFDTISNYTTTYTSTGSCYANSFNYGTYYNNSKCDTITNSNFQHNYTTYSGNTSTNSSEMTNISQQYPSKTFDSQKPFYAEQPSTNFTFSLTAVSKTQPKYTSSSINKSQTQAYLQPQDVFKKTNPKSCNYNYNLENTTPRTLSSHSIARLNSKYENHKENDVPFYLDQHISYSKSSKSNVNQSLSSNNVPCIKYTPVQLPQTKSQPVNNKTTKTPSSSNHSQFTLKYGVDWMSSSEKKSSNSDFQLFTPMEFSQTSSINQSSYYSPVTNFDINRKTSDLYFAHPPGEENISWSPNRMSNVLESPLMSTNQCFPTTLPNLNGDLALNTMHSSSSRSNNSVLETPTKNFADNCGSTFNSKDTKRSNDSQNSSFSVRQLVDINTGNKNVSGDKTSTTRRKTNRKESELDTYSNDLGSYDNHKSNIYSAESLINPKSSKSKSSWNSDSHVVSQELNLSSTIFSNVETINDQYNYSSNRYDPKLFNQNYVSTFIDNSLSNSTQNFHNFAKNQNFGYGDQLNSTIDFLQSNIGGTVNSFLSHSDTTEKNVPNLYTDLSKNSLSTNSHFHHSKTNNMINNNPSHTIKKSKSSHQSTPSHHSLLMNYDFPVPPVTPSLTYFPTHDWKNTASETYPACTNGYVNNMNLYSQNISQNSQHQNNNLITHTGNSVQNSSNSLTNFNLSSICPEINDKVRHQNW